MTGKTIAIIPARGGSKRIPRKNLAPFHGKPLIAWTILAAQESECCDEILVSTDDREIADTAEAYGAIVPELRDKYADDFSNVSQASAYSLIQAETHLNRSFEHVIQLLPSCPLRGGDHIDTVFQMLLKSRARSVMSCFKLGWLNPWWAFRLDDQHRASELFPDAKNKRSQDLDDLYCVSGAVWAARAETLRQHRSFYIEDRRYCPIHWMAAIDIDEPEDLEMALALKSFATHRN
jgi:CMP-N-acetylneuraminic acid synthetase